ncbi:MAG: alpha/beta hydrolase fold domain-containing protein [Sporolactobacillus sp.]
MFKEQRIPISINALDQEFQKKIKLVPGENQTGVLDPLEMEIMKNKVVNRKRMESPADALIRERNSCDRVVSNDMTEHFIDEKALILDFSSYKLIGYLFSSEEVIQNAQMILFVHGGGFTSGKIEYYRNQCRLLAERSHHKVLFIEYRLAPENPYPAQVNDIVRSVEYVLDCSETFQVSGEKVILVGDSAGGGIINGVVLKMTQEKISMIVELYSVTDIDIIGNGKYRWDYGMYPIIKEQQELVYTRLDRFRNGTEQLMNYYLGNNREILMNADISINYATNEQLRLFPRTLLIEAEYDFYRVGMDIFASRLLNNNINLSVIEYCGCDHGFIDHLGQSEQAYNAIDEISQTIIDELC